MVEKLDIAIRVQNVCKAYRLYDSKKQRIVELVHPLGKKLHKPFLALDDISFDITKGEIVGIIGQNGSGKSTLFKILASVVSPTSGTVECKGRVTALLEMGGGFNQELTGRENLYFIGAIQGFSRKEMDARIQGIIDFADIGTYIDQPVKNYSSGMSVRLAFSMTTNIDPEILITDEALSVGDLRFQQKCYRHIRELKDQGKTIILCTHGLSTVREFCTRAIWLHKGQLMEDGDPITVTQNYTAFMASKAASTPMLKQASENGADNGASDSDVTIEGVNWQNLSKCESYGIGGAAIRHAGIIEMETQKPPMILKGGEKLRLLLRINVTEAIPNAGIHMALNAQFGNPILKIHSNTYAQKLKLIEGVPSTVAFEFEFPHIANGKYTLSFGVLQVSKDSGVYKHWVHDGLILDVSNENVKYKNGAMLILPEVSVKVI
jgi:ABC-type polysaccharide/polyol phosphate transport system ATPase subunit